MKKYHIADVLTLSEAILAVILTICAMLNVSADYAIWVFAAAELCDAFDGICARRWPYPNDGKVRWWRQYASEIDELTDIMVGLACLLFVGLRVNPSFSLLVLVCALIVGIGVQVIVKWTTTKPYLERYGLQPLANWLNHRSTFIRLATWFDTHPRTQLVIILLRRYLYVTAIFLLVIQLIFATTWAFYVQISANILLALIGMALCYIKLDRLTQDKTFS